MLGILWSLGSSVQVMLVSLRWHFSMLTHLPHSDMPTEAFASLWQATSHGEAFMYQFMWRLPSVFHYSEKCHGHSISAFTCSEAMLCCKVCTGAYYNNYLTSDEVFMILKLDEILFSHSHCQRQGSDVSLIFFCILPFN